MATWERFPIHRYAGAILAAGLTLLVTKALGHMMASDILLPFLATVAVIALYWGLGPGLSATISSAFAVHYFHFRSGDSLGIGLGGFSMLSVFLATGFLISVICAERRRAEKKLRVQAGRLVESETRYRELFENANDIMYTLDLSGNFTSLNKAGERVSGYTRGEALQMNIRQVVAPEYLEAVQEVIARAIAGNESAPIEAEIVAKDGHRVILEVSGRAIFKQRSPIAVQGIARDVSERKILERKIMQSQKMEAIGVLTGGIAHDFNNLLTVINGYSEFLLNDLPQGDERRSDLEQIKRAGQRAADLTSQLLAFGRKQMVKPRNLNLNEIIADTGKILRRLIGEDINLVAVTDPDLGPVKADPGQMQQVIMNLVVNARDAMPKGGKLTIETANVELDDEYVRKHVAGLSGRYVMLAISDNGLGMDARTRARIFEPFFTTKKPGEGTGLGLSTVYGIVKQSGGFIWVYSEIGKGTTFKVYLPRVEGKPEQLVAKFEEGQSMEGSETLLVAEDDPSLRVLVARILRSHGYTVLEASNGEEALRTAEEYGRHIHMLLTDVVMPEMSGGALSSKVEKARPGIKVLFISGYTGNAIVHHGILESDVSLLTKPFSAEDLARRVREVLNS